MAGAVELPARGATTAPVQRLPVGLDLAVLTAAAIAEAVLITLLVRHSLGYLAFIVQHLIVVLALGVRLAAARRVAGSDTTMLALATLATFCVGPLGCIGALVAVLIAPIRAGTTPLLSAWYSRIAHSVETDPVTQLCDMVAIGRSVDLGGPPPASFSSVMSNGSLVERQALLGLIARKFDTDYLPALKLALTSPEPVIRVQAAAVATRVQVALGGIVRSWAERCAGTAPNAAPQVDAIDALGGIVTLEACLASGLIEAADRGTAQVALTTLREGVRAATAVPDFKLRLLAARANPYQLTAFAAYEGLLVAGHRFKELRNWRRLQRAGRLPQYRLRSSSRRRRMRPAASLEVAA